MDPMRIRFTIFTDFRGMTSGSIGFGRDPNQPMKNLMNLKVVLSNKVIIPQIGYGTFQIRDTNVIDPLKVALDSGYTHIDTAQIYSNEKSIGDVLSEYDRKSLFITSKLPPNKQGFDHAMTCFHNSLKDLKMDYLDLYLIHWPGVSKTKVLY
jgi:diketogulonate reductase-like aldo/keto reductase